MLMTEDSTVLKIMVKTMTTNKAYKTVVNQLKHWRNIRDVAVLKVELLEQDKRRLKNGNGN